VEPVIVLQVVVTLIAMDTEVLRLTALDQATAQLNKLLF
jgi:hypothetical protein